MIDWWRKKWSNSRCGITQSRLRPGKNKKGIPYTIKLKCSHSFYRSALYQWVLTQYPETPNCPICRQYFNVNIFNQDAKIKL